MRICIPIIMYGRHEVFKVCAQGIRNLIRSFPDIDFHVLVVGTGDREAVEIEGFEDVEIEGFEYFEFTNDNLGNKAQHRIEKAKETNADYYLFLGSDDVMSVSVFAYCLEFLRDGYDHVAPYDIYYIFKRTMYYFEEYPEGNPRRGEPLAVGRFLSKSLLEKLNWQLWNSSVIERGLDKIAWDRYQKAADKTHYYYLAEIGGFIIDIKTTGGLSKFTPDRYTGKVTDNLSCVLPWNMYNKIISL